MDDIHAVDTNSIVMDEGHAKNLSWFRCPKRPRLNVYNDAFCPNYKPSSIGDKVCIYEIKERRIDGFTYCAFTRR